MLRSKILGAILTGKAPGCEGSIALDRRPMNAADLLRQGREAVALAAMKGQPAAKLLTAVERLVITANGNLSPPALAQQAQRLIRQRTDAVLVALQDTLTRPLVGLLSEFAEAIRKARHMLYLAGNAGEIVFDRDLLAQPPPGCNQDLGQMLKDLISRDVPIRVCGTCMARCGIHRNHPGFAGADSSTRPALAERVVQSDKVITF
jgi:uncharacterized protein involved in oxidation of intracellular sulfur